MIRKSFFLAVLAMTTINNENERWAVKAEVKIEDVEVSDHLYGFESNHFPQ